MSIRHYVNCASASGDFCEKGTPWAARRALNRKNILCSLLSAGCRKVEVATIRTLADRMVLKHHGTVELIDRLVNSGYVRRSRGRDDRRLVTVSLLPRGQRVLERVAKHRISELRSNERRLIHAINQLLEHGRQPRNANRQRKSLPRRGRDHSG